jgi:hypothetical protein
MEISPSIVESLLRREGAADAVEEEAEDDVEVGVKADSWSGSRALPLPLSVRGGRGRSMEVMLGSG